MQQRKDSIKQAVLTVLKTADIDRSADLNELKQRNQEQYRVLTELIEQAKRGDFD